MVKVHAKPGQGSIAPLRLPRPRPPEQAARPPAAAPAMSPIADQVAFFKGG